jgi:hypothetical protein
MLGAGFDDRPLLRPDAEQGVHWRVNTFSTRCTLSQAGPFVRRADQIGHLHVFDSALGASQGWEWPAGGTALRTTLAQPGRTDGRGNPGVRRRVHQTATVRETKLSSCRLHPSD